MTRDELLEWVDKHESTGHVVNVSDTWDDNGNLCRDVVYQDGDRFFRVSWLYQAGWGRRNPLPRWLPGGKELSDDFSPIEVEKHTEVVQRTWYTPKP